MRIPRRPTLASLMATAILVAVAALIVDQTTGAKTGPPYHDPLVNQIAFFVLFATVPVIAVLAFVMLVRFVRRRGTSRRERDDRASEP